MGHLPLSSSGLPGIAASIGLSVDAAGAARAREAGAAAQPARRDPRSASRSMFRIIRYFSVASFVCIVVAAVALTAYFRHITIRELVEFGESGNVALAEAALNSVRAELVDFLDVAGKAAPSELAALPLAPALAHEIDDLMRVKSVARIKIYDPKGVVVYATRQVSVGRQQEDNPGFQAAMAGRVVSKLVYRDAFNAFDSQSEEDNLIQTYVPIHSESGQVPRGVFELYTDVNPMVEDTELAQWQIIGGAVLIMAMLYVALLMVVQYAERIISQQQQEIRDYAAALEQISARLLSSQEEEKKKIAFDLHEGVAQTLSAVKMSVESAARQLSSRGKGDAAALQPMVQAVREAINEVRSVALNLRPSSLDELGLVATIEWFCREFSRLHPEIAAERDIRVDERDVPAALKIIVYRVLEEACRALGRAPGISRLGVALEADEETLGLVIRHDAAATDDALFETARERTLLSGGTFQSSSDGSGLHTLRAAWLR